MAVKRTGQLSFVDALLPHRSGRLDRLAALVKWYRFEKRLGGLRSEGPGRAGYAPRLMFKALLQSLYVLSDAELEDALGDRLYFAGSWGWAGKMRSPITRRSAASDCG